jgi:hypothetical protein
MPYYLCVLLLFCCLQIIAMIHIVYIMLIPYKVITMMTISIIIS